MKPLPSIVRGDLPKGTRAFALVEPGRQYALFLDGGEQADLRLDLPAGRYRAEWVDTRSGGVVAAEDLKATDETDDAAIRRSTSEDIALRIMARQD